MQKGRASWLLALLILGALSVVGLSGGCKRSAATSLPSPQARLEASAQRMASLTSLSFTLTHEKGRTPLMAGVEAQKAQGVVALPDQASLQVEAIAAGLGAFFSLKIIVKGNEALMTDPLSGAWRRLSASSLPFNFLDLGKTLADIARSMRDPAYTASQELGGVLSQGIRGSVTGGQLARLIPVADPKATVSLELWVGTDDLIRRVHITGPVASQDAPEVVRLLEFAAFNQPVTIPEPR